MNNFYNFQGNASSQLPAFFPQCNKMQHELSLLYDAIFWLEGVRDLDLTMC